MSMRPTKCYSYSRKNGMILGKEELMNPASKGCFDNMSMEIQRRRCKVYFRTLEFVPRAKTLGDALINRLSSPPIKNSPDEKQEKDMGTLLSLIFASDMASHSPCDYGGGKSEKLALPKYSKLSGKEES